MRTPCTPPPPDPPLHPYENWLVPPLDGRRTTAHRATAHRIYRPKFPGVQPAVEIDYLYKKKSYYVKKKIAYPLWATVVGAYIAFDFSILHNQYDDTSIARSRSKRKVIICSRQPCTASLGSGCLLSFRPTF